jgi:hypothetical protein
VSWHFLSLCGQLFSKFNITDNERQSTHNFLRSKQNKIRSLKLVGFIVEGLMPIGSEEDPEDVDEDSPSRVCIVFR